MMYSDFFRHNFMFLCKSFKNTRKSILQWLKDVTGFSGVQLLVHNISYIGPRDSTVFQKFLDRSNALAFYEPLD